MAGVIGDREYNLKRVSVLFNGVRITGAADGDFVTITPNSPAYTHTAGAMGEVAVSANNDTSGVVMIRLFQAAASQISVIENAIRLARTAGLQTGTWISIVVTDLSTGEQIVMSQCWPADQPTRAFGQEQQAREYSFGYAEAVVMPR